MDIEDPAFWHDYDRYLRSDFPLELLEEPDVRNDASEEIKSSS